MGAVHASDFAHQFAGRGIHYFNPVGAGNVEPVRRAVDCYVVPAAVAANLPAGNDMVRLRRRRVGSQGRSLGEAGE